VERGRPAASRAAIRASETARSAAGPRPWGRRPVSAAASDGGPGWGQGPSWLPQRHGDMEQRSSGPKPEEAAAEEVRPRDRHGALSAERSGEGGDGSAVVPAWREDRTLAVMAALGCRPGSVAAALGCRQRSSGASEYGSPA
jgi:hypothetical protein